MFYSKSTSALENLTTLYIPALKVFDVVPAGGSRGRGRSPLRWKYQVEKCLAVLGMSNWRQTAKRRMAKYYKFGYIRVSGLYVSKKEEKDDESYFYLDGYVNKQNYRSWGSEKLRFIAEKLLHLRCVTVCARVIAPYSFENSAGAKVMVNRLRYRETIND